MLNYVSSASDFLTTNFDEWKERHPAEIQAAFNGFLTGVGNLIESATVASGGETEQQKRVLLSSN